MFSIAELKKSLETRQEFFAYKISPKVEDLITLMPSILTHPEHVNMLAVAKLSQLEAAKQLIAMVIDRDLYREFIDGLYAAGLEEVWLDLFDKGISWQYTPC